MTRAMRAPKSPVDLRTKEFKRFLPPINSETVVIMATASMTPCPKAGSQMVFGYVHSKYQGIIPKQIASDIIGN